MKDEKEKSLNEYKGKRKRNEGKVNNENSDIFNPHLSARELKKIQYYENMFKKMEQKKEENTNDGDYRCKKKHNKIKRVKKVYTYKKDLSEHIEKNSKKSDNNLRKINSIKDIDSCKNFNKNESKKKKNVILNSNINQNLNEKFSKRKESLINVKKEKVIKQKLNNSKNIENSKMVTTKNENCVNSNQFNSDSNYRMHKLFNTKYNSNLNENDYSHKVASKLKNNKIKEVKKNRKKILFKNNRLIINFEKGYLSDNIINYNNINQIRCEYDKTYSGKEEDILKIRSVSVSSNKNDYFLDNSRIQLKSRYDYSTSENKIMYKNYNSHSFENKKRKILNYFINNAAKKTNIFNEFLKKKMKKKINDNDYNFQIKNDLNSISRNLESSLESNYNLKLCLNDKEVTDENVNSKSYSIEYFNEEENERKKEINDDFNFKSHNESNNIIDGKKISNVNYCIKKYLDNMRYTNLKKFKKINKENLKIYVKNCVNFLSFNKFDNAILCLLNLQSTLQKKGKK
ncbi:conserved Plasmodium protein, unknown function [Plasmodium relictum]|uniref:Uncharacterized protein n=1 Tax=Plasmodium relictum TaxID=85471 RepID=A0A1J1HCA3_PLARL|nr:conserved Plasmodium protein, unknown function [Plasmodium relictum]CRH02935.1 conserved Plasmodium protein, unknown function [Plasmodium relictum]